VQVYTVSKHPPWLLYRDSSPKVCKAGSQYNTSLSSRRFTRLTQPNRWLTRQPQ